ncbi:MAG: hypothetical protein R2883_08535 [Caldisericia bacterium]
MAKRRRLNRVFIWSLIILSAILYLVFYTVQTQRVLTQDNINKEKRALISELRQEKASLEEQSQQASLAELKKKAEELFGMRSVHEKYLPNPKEWFKNHGK